MPRPREQEFPELRTTRWHNPTPHKQRVLVHPDGPGGQVRAYYWEPDEIKEVPANLDRAIHMVDCGRDECHKTGWYCSKGHDGVIMGGGAPLLRRVGHNDELNPILDPDLAAKKEAETELVSQALVQKAAMQGMVAALAQQQTAVTKIAANSKAEEDAKLEAATKPDEKPASVPAHIPSKK